MRWLRPLLNTAGACREVLSPGRRAGDDLYGGIRRSAGCTLYVGSRGYELPYVCMCVISTSKPPTAQRSGGGGGRCGAYHGTIWASKAALVICSTLPAS